MVRNPTKDMVCPINLMQGWRRSSPTPPTVKVRLPLVYSKTCVKQPITNRLNKYPYDKWKLNEGQKYCRMLLLEHFAIRLTCIKHYWS